MRHVLALAVAALAIAVVLVLVVGEDETAEEDTTVGVTEPQPEPGRTETGPTAPPEGNTPAQTADVERAVELYVEAAETGETDAPPGLPTTDELSIRSVRIAGNRATARLAGGPRLVLLRTDGHWRVTRVLSVG
jgi:hypothetical protein